MNHTVPDILLLQVGHIYERHSAAIETEHEHVAGTIQLVGVRKFGLRDTADHFGAHGQLASFLDPDGHGIERRPAPGYITAFLSLVVNGTEITHVKRHRIGLQGNLAKVLFEIKQQVLVHVIEMDTAASDELFEGDQRRIILIGRTLCPLFAQLLDLPCEKGMHVTVVVTPVVGLRDIPNRKRFPFALQFGQDALHLFLLFLQKNIDLVDERRMGSAPGCGGGFSAQVVELLGQQPVGCEDHAPAALPDQLYDQRIATVTAPAANIQHRPHAHIGMPEAPALFLVLVHNTSSVKGLTIDIPYPRHSRTRIPPAPTARGQSP